MLLKLQFVHLQFLLKKIKTVNFLKSKTWFLYCSLLKKINFFYLIQGIKYSIPKIIIPKCSYNLKFKIPDKTVFNLFFLDWVNSVKCLKLVEGFNFYNCGIKQIKHTVLRSPFVHKTSREQFCYNYYKGNFTYKFFMSNFLISEFVKFYFSINLNRLISFNIKKIKKIRLS